MPAVLDNEADDADKQNTIGSGLLNGDWRWIFIKLNHNRNSKSCVFGQAAGLGNVVRWWQRNRPERLEEQTNWFSIFDSIDGRFDGRAAGFVKNAVGEDGLQTKKDGSWKWSNLKIYNFDLYSFVATKKTALEKLKKDAWKADDLKPIIDNLITKLSFLSISVIERGLGCGRIGCSRWISDGLPLCASLSACVWIEVILIEMLIGRKVWWSSLMGAFSVCLRYFRT